jgi:polysaccharide deacetylase 2 family uncharacterized protein YibQ
VPRFFRNETRIGASFNSQISQKTPLPSRCTRRLFAVVGFALVFFAGCSKKPVAKNDMRAVTAEVVESAEKIGGNKGQVVIRPRLQILKRKDSQPVPVDDIYISLNSPPQTHLLDESLHAIAQRHGLAIDRSAGSPGVTRFDFSLNGIPTHTIHVVKPLGAKAQPPARKNPGATGAPRLAIIIDDMGYDRAAADAVIALPFPLTVSVLPHLPISSEVAEEAHSRGDQVLLHLPMESDAETAKSEEVELRVGMSAAQVSSAVAAMLDTVPDAVGVNNHQGSRATSDPALMRSLMPVLRERGLFFIDSRTDAKTVAFETAKRAGLRAASRKVFLDDTATQKAIIAQLELAARDATRDGVAIAIGHPRPATIAALAQEVPRLESRGIRLVFASDVVQ